LSTTLQETACANNGYFFNGSFLFNSGTYRDTLPSSLGCDSVIELQLNVFQPSFNQIKKGVCADSTFNFNGNILTQSGTYFDTLKNNNSCDSVIQLDLHVGNPLVEWNWNGDTLYSNGNNILLVGGTPFGGVYSGEGVVGNLFNPTIAGNGIHFIYYTYQDSNGCQSTVSKTVIVSGINAIEVLENDDWQIFPNPAKSSLFILSKQTIIQEIKVYNSNGKCVIEKNNANTEKQVLIDIGALPTGMYIIKISTPNSCRRKLFSVLR
jgi:hypothetical protein